MQHQVAMHDAGNVFVHITFQPPTVQVAKLSFNTIESAIRCSLLGFQFCNVGFQFRNIVLHTSLDFSYFLYARLKSDLGGLEFGEV